MKALQTEIIQRFLSEDNYKQFVEDYKAARKRFRRDRRLTDFDRMVYKDYQNGILMTELVGKYHISLNRIKSIILLSAEKI